MKEKKSIIIAIAILLFAIVATIGASYAYFATVNKTSGNDKKLNITTEDLGSIKWEGTKVFTSDNLLPGECGVQIFSIEKNSPTGKGVYEIDLKGVIDESFDSDVEITLYKSIDTTTNNVTIKEGTSTISGDTTKQYYKEDSVVINGTPEKVYGTSVLQNDERIKLEQADFDNSTLEKTTYYLVYCYKNNGNQDHQQGKSFSGEISVRLILDKNGPELKASSIDEWKSVIPINISMQDNKSGLKEYQISDVDEIPSTWKSISGNNVEVTEEVTSNKIYYIYAKNQLNNISRTSINITKVDNIGPVVDFDVTTGNGTAVVDASKSVDNESGIAKYEYSVDNGTYYSSSASSYNFTNLSHGSHTFNVRITDNVGNINSVSKVVSVTLTYTINYNANGGSGAPGSQTKTHDTNLTLSSTKPTKTGYTFLGWSTSSNATSASYTAGGTYSANANATLYAVWKIATTSKTITKNVTTALNNWQAVRTLVQFGEVYASTPSVSISGDNEQRVMYVSKTYALVTSSHAQGGGTWNVTVTVTGNAYSNASASKIINVTGTTSISINNWAGGSKYISFGKTFKSPPSMNWYSPSPSANAIANDWNISFSNITTTGCTMSWSKSTGGETKTIGWIAEGEVN